MVEAVENPYSGQPAALILAKTTHLPEGTEV
jgi:hypothetical protein